MIDARHSLTENDVVDAVCAYLDRAGWAVDQRLRTSERGVDIVATRSDGQILCVEAKGATSSKVGTARHGRPFSRAQIASHVARAFYTAAAVEGSTGDCGLSALALPATAQHKEFVARVAGAIERLGIGVFWVAAPDSVHYEAGWTL